MIDIFITSEINYCEFQPPLIQDMFLIVIIKFYRLIKYFTYIQGSELHTFAYFLGNCILKIYFNTNSFHNIYNRNINMYVAYFCRYYKMYMILNI